MKVLASYLAVILAATPACAASAPAPAPPLEEPVGVEVDTLTVTAPRLKPETVRQLKTARTTGMGAAAAGAGWLGYVVLVGTGPFGWAAALLFLGGMSAYLADRKLAGEEDFAPGAKQPAASPRAAPTPSR